MTPRPRDVVYRLADRLWSGELGAPGRAVSLGFLPLAGAWRAAVWFRNRRFDASDATTVGGLRVISIGNLAVGGTGKTPFVSWVVGVLEEAGQESVILRRDNGDDETHLHQTWRPRTAVYAGPDRAKMAIEARDRGAEVVVLDDGFQHRHLARDLDLVLLAVEDGVSEPLLPRGRFREPLSALARADAVVLTRRRASAEQARRLATALTARVGGRDPIVQGCVHLSPGSLEPFSVWAQARPLAEVGTAGVGAATPHASGQNGSVDSPLVVTAIARPRALLRDVASLCSGTTTLLAFPDHHDYGSSDVIRIRQAAQGRPVVVTEKDAVKLRHLPDLPDNMWVLGQELIWDWGVRDVERLVLDLAGTARR